jgi:hypothetical protein
MQSQVFLYADRQALTLSVGLCAADRVRGATGNAESGGRCAAAFFMSFPRHGEIFRSDVGSSNAGSRSCGLPPALIGFDEFPVGYSLAGCPPADPASALPTDNDSKQSTLPKTNNNSKTKSKNKTKTKNKIKVVYTEDLTHPGQEERRPSAAPLTAPQVSPSDVYANVGKQIKEGRHVGLDFYDLLIEALIDPMMSAIEMFQQQSF